mgnify:CR=1 FL=1
MLVSITIQGFRLFVEDFCESAGDVFINGREGGGKTTAYWYGTPYIHGTAHAGSEHITQGRNVQFAQIAK